MGTSTRNSGQNGHNPLLPTWLEDDSMSATSGQELNPEQSTNVSLQQPIPPDADPNRFRGPRTSFSHFVSGGGRDHSTMHRGISHYISRSLGGSKNATKRLGASRASTARLFGILNSLTGADGLNRVAQFLSIETLEGLPASSFFIRLAKFVCPDGGPDDEGVSRSAYFDTVADNPNLMNKNIASLSKDEIDSVLQKYMTKVVMQQIMNGIANNTIRLPESLIEVSQIEDSVETSIEQSVADSFSQIKQQNGEMTSKKAKEITDSIYQKIFENLEGASD